MCGILGFSGYVREGQWSETYDLLNALLVASECRGKDATGFVARTEPLKNCLAANIVFGKAPMPAKQFINENPSWRSLAHTRSSSCLAHVRWATNGDPKLNVHNHPLVGNSQLFLVHNGVLSDHEATAAQHGLELRTEVDSELLLRFVENAKHPALGLDRALRKTKGSSCVVVYDGQRDVLYLARNEGRPLWLLKLAHDRRWWFASTREILLAAFQAVLGNDAIGKVENLFPLASNSVHVLTNSGRLIALPNNRNE